LRPGARAASGNQRSESAPLTAPATGRALISCGEGDRHENPCDRCDHRIIGSAGIAEEDPSKAAGNKAEEQKKKESEEIEKAYKDMLKRTTREQPVKKADPWGNMR